MPVDPLNSRRAVRSHPLNGQPRDVPTRFFVRRKRCSNRSKTLQIETIFAKNLTGQYRLVCRMRYERVSSTAPPPQPQASSPHNVERIRRVNGSGQRFLTTETELVNRLSQGDEEAFAYFCKRYEGLMFRTAYRITRSDEDAWDVVQDALLRVFRRIDSFRADASLSTWLTRIVINCSFMNLRKRRSHPTLSLEESSPENPCLLDTLEDPRINIEDSLLHKSEVNSLNCAIASLRPVLRETIEAYRQHDLSMVELANHCGITIAAAKSRLLRARNALRGAGIAEEACSKPRAPQQPTARKTLRSKRKACRC